MKKTTLALLIILLIAGTVSTSFGQKPEVKYINAGENLQQTSNDVVDVIQDLKKIPKNFNSEFQNFKNKYEIRIHNNEKVFAEFKVNYLKSNQKDKATFQKMVNQFEKENNALKNKLVNYNNEEGTSKWKSFKRGFKHDMDVLGVQMWSVN